jgi:hypothetical protein
VADTYYRTFHFNYVGIAATAVVLGALASVIVYAIRRRATRR